MGCNFLGLGFFFSFTLEIGFFTQSGAFFLILLWRVIQVAGNVKCQ